jgi:DNA-dependent RNA polymerase auxiliary subunit epsilon
MSEKNSNDLLTEYHQKIEQFLKIDELNMKDAQMALPAVRHFWVGRLMFHKQQIVKLKKAKEKAEKMLKQKIQEESPVLLNPKTLYASIESHEVVQKIKEEIDNNELLVEYLSKVESNFRDAQYGMNNLTKIITLETT